jgi:deazaflavin-dependent oxidoreductase (nitroreductase family)
MSAPADFNAHTIAEFRKNGGKVGGMFEGAPLLLIHATGRSSGKSSVIPVMYLKDGERYLVFASKAGADTHPDWYTNLKAHPDVKIEVGDQTIDVRAEEVTGHERDTIYKRQAALYPNFAEYERKTKRKIPVIAFTKRKK